MLLPSNEIVLNKTIVNACKVFKDGFVATCKWSRTIIKVQRYKGRVHWHSKQGIEKTKQNKFDWPIDLTSTTIEPLKYLDCHIHYTLDTTLCDKVCQWLATGWWFSLVFSTNKTGRHDITEILLKVALNTIPSIILTLIWHLVSSDNDF
jgi:hypothetical protein